MAYLPDKTQPRAVRHALVVVDAEAVLKRLARWCRNNIGLLERLR